MVDVSSTVDGAHPAAKEPPMAFSPVRLNHAAVDAEITRWSGVRTAREITFEYGGSQS
jgi:hypothetical protein